MTTRDEPFLSIWARRAVTVPVTFLAATLALVSAPLWLAGGIGADLLAGSGRRLPRTRALVFFALYLGCEVAGILAASALWLGTLGGRLGGPARYLEANALLQRWWAAALFFGSVRLFSLSVSTEGLERARGGPFLLLVRHASTADTVLAAALVARPARLLLRYVLKRELLRDPCIDIVGRRLPNTFAARQGPRREARIAAVARLAEGLDARSGVLIYPEGTRFSEAKRAAAVSRLKEKGRDDLAAIASNYRHVLPPRLGGPLALLAAAPGVDVVFFEHTGFEGAASFREFWAGSLVDAAVHVRLRRVAASEIPDEGRDRWLFEQWAEVDRWIAAVRHAGRQQAPRR